MLCGSCIAQSTFSSDQTINSSTGSVFTPARPIVHGFGVTYLSSYYPDSSYKEAYHLAIEDLTANLFTSVYLESFITTGVTRVREFAITDTIDTEQIVPLDSLQHEGKVYYFVSVRSSNDNNSSALEKAKQISVETWTGELFTPYEDKGYWIASGKERLSRYNPYKSWAKSKLDALSNLSKILHTLVQSSNKTLNASYREVTYISSKNLFSNILVLRRTVRDGYCYTLLAVHKSDITPLNKP